VSVGGGVACKMIKGYYFVIGNFSASERERAKQSEASEAKRSEAKRASTSLRRKFLVRYLFAISCAIYWKNEFCVKFSENHILHEVPLFRHLYLYHLY